jgi:hypothetical protein
MEVLFLHPWELCGGHKEGVRHVEFKTLFRPCSKDELYAGYCGGIPIPGCWYWYSISGSNKSSIPNTTQYQRFTGNTAIQNKEITHKNVLPTACD